MEKDTNTIDRYFRSFPREQSQQKHFKSEENIYQRALKRKTADDCDQVRQKQRFSPSPSISTDARDEIIKRQHLEIQQWREKHDKFKKTQNEMLKLLHFYRLRLHRFEKASGKVNIPTESAALNLPSDDEITEEQKAQYFSEWELTQLNSINKRKSEDRAYARKLFEFLYRDNLSALHKRTLSSTSKTGKQPITPSKLEIMKQMMDSRCKKSDDMVYLYQRITPKYITAILSDALYTVKNKHALKEN